MAESKKSFTAKINDEDLKGHYSNLLRVSHTREEFILDFLNAVPPQAIVTSRIITSPGHLKRIVRALTENLERYEKAFGVVEEAASPIRDAEIN
jgi:hypothetical protein